MTQPARPPLRCDAEVNRARIIDFARETFARTPEATVKSIARGAGVGQGTMYRHFPTRDDLLLGVYGEDVEALAECAASLLERHEPVTALRLWLERLAAYAGQDTAAARAVQAATRPDAVGAHHALVSEVVDRLLRACAAVGRLRGDVGAHEVLLLMSCVWNSRSGSVDGSGSERPGECRAVLDIVMDGLTVPGLGKHGYSG